MKKNYIKMNDYKHLSIGNVINIIKKISNNNNAMQTEIFCSIIGINDINITTVNNYCIGIRAIGLECKKIFEENYKNDSLKNNILSIINILDDKIYSIDDGLEIINKSIKLTKVIKELLKVAKNDEHIDDETIFIKENNYETIKELLYYAIIENKQPVYSQQTNVKINKDEMDEYLKLELYWGQNYISSLIELAKRNNMYACAKLAALEYDGEITGERNYKKAYEYYLKAANKDHPKACWMIAHLMISNYIEYDFNTMWKYLNKAIELGSAAAYNTMGKCYLNGNNKNNEINKEKAEYYFKISSELGYVFAFNNLGLLNEDNEEESIKYYKISADMGNSWALNKVGEYYRLKKDMKTAYMYYSKAIECPINEICKFAYYNLAKYYYENGNKDANIKMDKSQAKYYYDKFNNE